MAYKVFTNGSTLQASELNENLMQQSIATFSNAAARTAAITSPVEGQMTYLLDTDRYEWWSGSAWRSPFGMTLLANVAASGTTVQFQNVFTSQFNNYKVVFNISSTANSRTVWTLLSGGTSISTNYRVNYEFGVTTRTLASSASTSDMTIQDAGYGANAFYSGELTIFSPALTAETAFTALSMSREAAGNVTRPQWQTSCGHHGVSSSYDGLQVSMFGGTMSGTIQIYGMRN